MTMIGGDEDDDDETELAWPHLVLTLNMTSFKNLITR